MTRLANPLESLLIALLALGGLKHPGSLAAAGVLFALCEIAAGIRRRPGPRWLPAWWPPSPKPVTVIYDADCVLCTRSKATLETWPTAGSIRFLALQSEEARALVPGMDEEAYRGAMHVVEEGTVWSAHEGWYRLMKLGPLPLTVLAALTPRGLARPLYAWVARNRYRWFGRVCEGGACRIHPKA